MCGSESHSGCPQQCRGDTHPPQKPPLSRLAKDTLQDSRDTEAEEEEEGGVAERDFPASVRECVNLTLSV